jgi:hypothetical protein
VPFLQRRESIGAILDLPAADEASDFCLSELSQIDAICGSNYYVNSRLKFLCLSCKEMTIPSTFAGLCSLRKISMK